MFLLAAFARDAGAQFRVGPEFRVNGTTAGSQAWSSVGLDAAGNFVVVWASEDPASGWDVFAQRFDARGQALGSELRVNTYTPNRQALPRVAVDPAGSFVVAWSSLGQDAHDYGVFAQRYDASGARRGAEFRVNTTEPGTQFLTDVATDASGNFAVVWLGMGQDDGQGVFAQRYDFGGSPVGAEFRVNTYGTGDQRLGSIAYDAAGRFVIVWNSVGQDGSGYGVFGQRYADTGAPLGAEFRLNAQTTGDQRLPSVAAGADGDFVVSWTSPDSEGKGIFARRFSAAGIPAGPEFQVNIGTFGDQDYARVGADPDGNVIVVWTSPWQPDDESFGVYSRVFTGSAQSSSDVRVNTYTLGGQIRPAIAVGPSGRFVVAWMSYAQDGSDFGIYAQRMNAGIIPSALPIEPGAQTLEVDEAVIPSDEGTRDK